MEGKAPPDRLLERALNRVERLWDAGDMVKVKEELEKLRKRYPGNVQVLGYHAGLARSEGHFEAALVVLDAMIAKDPQNDWAGYWRADVLTHLGRIHEALEGLRSHLDAPVKPRVPLKQAGLLHALGICFDRLGQVRNAEQSFEKAAALAPDYHPHPPRLSTEEFDSLIKDARASIPEDVKPIVGNLNVIVRDYPPPDWKLPNILGACQAGPWKESGEQIRNVPSTISIFKRNVELNTPKREDLPEQVRKTIVHEIAHHFGIPHERMGEYE